MALERVHVLEEQIIVFETENKWFKNNIFRLIKILEESECEKNINADKYDYVHSERSGLYKKIQELESNFAKRGQTYQTFFLINQRTLNFII